MTEEDELHQLAYEIAAEGEEWETIEEDIKKILKSRKLREKGSS